MTDVVICEPLRTPVGRFGGVLKDIAPEDLAATVIREIVSRSGIPGSDIDDVILGQASPSGENPAIGRIAALNAGLGVEFRASRWIDAAAPASRRSCRPSCRCRPAAAT